MKQLIYIMPLALGPVVAQVVDAKATFNAALDQVKEAQSENLGPVITAVLDATGGDEQAYFRFMQEAADAGHPVALNWMAAQLLRQMRVQRQDAITSEAAARVKALIEQAASTGYVPARVELAHLSGSGIGAPADEKTGMKHLMEACKANSPRARAAYLLLSGRLEKEGDASPAVRAELKRKNYFVEEFLSALMARSNEEKSREWLTLAAEHGSPGAACTLALYNLHQGDAVKGYEYLKLAADRDNPEALAQLAAMTLPEASLPETLKHIVKQDSGAAIRMFQRAALLGYTQACIPLAGEYLKQPEKYSVERIFELYRLAADDGDPRGGVAYAYCLANGRGCQQDAEKGVRILNELVDAGVAFANMALADLYFNGTGVPADMTKAISYLTAGASAGVPQCYTLMAVLSQLGNASKASDPARARIYLLMAEERGEMNARQSFDALVKAGGWKFIQ